jgi:hypothetical protein
MLHEEPRSHQAHSFQTASYVQRSSAVIDDKNGLQSSSPKSTLSPEPAAVIRSPPASNVSTPSDLQSPSLLQNVNILRDLRGSPVKGGAFHQHNSSFGEAASEIHHSSDSSSEEDVHAGK